MKGKQTILLCDDDDFLARMYAYKLESEGFNVVIVGSGSLVMSVLREVRPDLLILDLMMPEKSGFEILKEIHQDQDDTLKYIPCIVASNLAQQTDMDEVKAFNVADFIVKSRTTPRDLLEIVRKHLNTHVPA